MDNQEVRQDTFEHLDELRTRLIKMLIALLLAVAGSFFFADKILDILATPIGGLQNLQAIEVTENASVFMRVSLLSGFILAFPFLIFQLLRFIEPGLEPDENRSVYIFVVLATVLFLVGAAFSYFIMLPPALQFLTGFLGTPMIPRLQSYINFTTGMVFWTGISFETPLIFFFLAKFKIVTPKGLLRQWRLAIVAISILAAVISPTIDPMNMLIIMAPLVVLYFLSILLTLMAR